MQTHASSTSAYGASMERATRFELAMLSRQLGRLVTCHWSTPAWNTAFVCGDNLKNPLVGMTGFEPAWSRPRTEWSTTDPHPDGAPGRIQTVVPAVMSHLLWSLSYWGKIGALDET